MFSNLVKLIKRMINRERLNQEPVSFRHLKSQNLKTLQKEHYWYKVCGIPLTIEITAISEEPSPELPLKISKEERFTTKAKLKWLD